MATAAKAKNSGGEQVKTAGTKGKIALSTIRPVESLPERRTNSRTSIMREIVEQLQIPENNGKWFIVGEGKRTGAYQMRKRLKELLPGVRAEVRGIDAENAHVYANFDPSNLAQK